VQDVHNLAWKIAAVLNGRAPPRLLQSYEGERRPVADLSVELAYTRYVLRTDPSLGTGQCAPLVHDLNIELGYVYRSDAIRSEQPDDGLQHTSPRESRGRPGTRAPHLWLRRHGRRISSLDLFARPFVWLGGPSAAEWRRCAQAIGSAAETELEILQPGQDGLEDESGKLSELYGIAPGGSLLVRPDGFVAWRARSAKGASQQELQRALSSLLARPDAPV
jgi:putative polyketide hydroxylase